jgi:YedE family putative selenium metabolism protein
VSGRKGMILVGAMVGILAVALVAFGNPVNMGICIVCFIRDTAGALGLHRAGVVQYIRPEIVGIALGAWLMSLKGGDFRTRGGSAPFTRFILGFFVVIGALMFLGCPLRMVLRLAGGDLTAVFGLLGFTAGILVGVAFLNKGFTLNRTYNMSKVEGFMFPAMQVALLILLITAPAFIFFSSEGPGSLHAPVAISLIAGLLLGAAAQRTRLCMVGGIRDFVMFKDTHLISGFLAILVVALIGNVITAISDWVLAASLWPILIGCGTSWACFWPVWVPFCWAAAPCGRLSWLLRAILTLPSPSWVCWWELPLPTTSGWLPQELGLPPTARSQPLLAWLSWQPSA